MTGKRIKTAREAVETEKQYELSEAIELLQSVAKNSGAKFDETVDIVIKLGIDTKRQSVRGVSDMPSGTGKTVKVGVVCKEDKRAEAEEAGADFVWGEDFADIVQRGELPADLNRLVATPDVMAQLGKVGRILGPKGLMPNPKTGTVTKNIKEAVESAKSGQVEFRADKGGIVHAGIGKISFGKDDLAANAKALKSAVSKAKPEDSKGTYFKRAFLSSTMGPGVELNLSSLED